MEYSYSKMLFYRVSYFYLNRTKYFVEQEIDIDLDLTAVFSLKKVQFAVQTKSQFNTSGTLNITGSLKYFQYGEFKQV